MNFVASYFEDLTTRELYEICRARAEIFVVEQKMCCNDLDGADLRALHLYWEENGTVVAYLRALRADGDTVKIGRVLTRRHGQGLGRQLMTRSIAELREKMPCRKIVLDAQTHAVGFYERFGFHVTSEEFWEEGVLHVAMELDL